MNLFGLGVWEDRVRSMGGESTGVVRIKLESMIQVPVGDVNCSFCDLSISDDYQ